MPASSPGGSDGPDELQPASTPAVPEVERIGPFVVQGVLGRGSMGVVFDAVNADGVQVALKTIRPANAEDRAEQVAARFAREARILQQLDHPGIVRLIDAGEDDDLLYLAMERVEGVNLLTVRRQGPLGFDPLVQLGIQVADALAHLHEAGVVHRDIKPANILVRANGQPVITDFGISGLNEAADITRQGDLLGSPGFMAPEAIDGHPTSPASDQYSLGRLLFELGARGDAPRLPQDRPLLEMLTWAMQVEWQRFPPDAPWPRLRTVLARMMARDPQERYPSAQDVAETLRALRTSDALAVDTLGEHLQSLPLDAIIPDEEGTMGVEDPTTDLGRPPLRLPTRAGAPKGPTEGIPLEALVAQRRSPRSIASPPAAAEPSDAPAPPTADLPDIARAELARLTATNRRLREALRAGGEPSWPMRPVAVAAAIAFLLGLVLGLATAPSPARTPSVVLVPGRQDPTAASLLPSAVAPVTASAEQEAREMFDAAHDQLRKQDVAAARRMFELCIEMADLPECHRDLGALLALMHDPAARGHLLRYVQRRPNAPDTPAIRSALGEP